MSTLPSLVKLPLTAPTGVFNADGKRPMKAVRVEPEEAPEGPLTQLPVELREMFTRQLIATLKGDTMSLCRALSEWCTAHPEACAHESVWREALTLAFGLVVEPGAPVPKGLRIAILGEKEPQVVLSLEAMVRGETEDEREARLAEQRELQRALEEQEAWRERFDSMTWQDAFFGICRDFSRLPNEAKMLWANMAEWTPRELDAATFSTEARYDRGLARGTLLELLLLRGGDPDRHWRGEDLSRQLVNAAEIGELEDMRNLLARGAWPDYIDAREWHREVRVSTPLYQAVEGEQVEAVKMLLEAGVGATLNLDSQARDSRGAPINVAVDTGNAEILDLLLDYGATASSRLLTYAVTWAHNSENLGVILRLLLGKGRVRPTPAVMDYVESMLAGSKASGDAAGIGMFEHAIAILKEAMMEGALDALATE